MDLDPQYLWITTRRLKPGTRKEFSQRMAAERVS